MKHLKKSGIYIDTEIVDRSNFVPTTDAVFKAVSQINSNSVYINNTDVTEHYFEIDIPFNKLNNGLFLTLYFAGRCNVDDPYLKINDNNYLIKYKNKRIVAKMGYWDTGATLKTKKTWDSGTIIPVVFIDGVFQIVGNPILSEHISNASGTQNENENSYIVYANGIVHQWGTFDHGSNTREIKETVNFLVNHSTSGFMSNFTVVAPSSQNYFVGSLGIKSQTTQSMLLNFWGAGENDKTRYLKWETLGL